jgi:ribonuclease HII
MSRTRPGLAFHHEAACRARGLWPVAGADEAGRGPWAGPVVAAAVILDPDRMPAGLDDSKKLSPARRAALDVEIRAQAHVAVALAEPDIIDRLNIRAATLDALARAVAALPVKPSHVLMDGRDLVPGFPGEAIVGGDAKVASIAAASIVAKVARDRLMVELAKLYPGYGFDIHKGYGVPAHREALDRLGPCPAHRASFAPIRDALRARGLG